MSSVKEKMLKRFNHEKDSDDKRLIPPLPGSLNIEITSACNHNCFFCAYHSNLSAEKVEPKFMDGGLVKRIALGFPLTGLRRRAINLPMAKMTFIQW